MRETKPEPAMLQTGQTTPDGHWGSFKVQDDIRCGWNTASRVLGLQIQYLVDYAQISFTNRLISGG